MTKRNLYTTEAVPLENCHNGEGTLKFRVILEKEFQSQISFLHYTTIPPAASIGYHKHEKSEEVYIILKGEAVMVVDGQETTVKEGDVVLTQCGSSHSLYNNSGNNVEILVFEGRL